MACPWGPCGGKEGHAAANGVVSRGVILVRAFLREGYLDGEVPERRCLRERALGVRSNSNPLETNALERVSQAF